MLNRRNDDRFEQFPKDNYLPSDARWIEGDMDRYNVRWIEDVCYRRTDEQALMLQILEPYKVGTDLSKYEEEGLDQKLTTIVYVPGSAWHKQNVKECIPRLYKYAEKGYTVALVEYRPTENKAYFPAQVLDVKAAIRFLKENPEKYSVNPEEMVIFGDSSGGHTSLLVGFTGEDALTEPSEDMQSIDCLVKGIVDFYGPTHLESMGDYPSVFDHTSADSPEGYLIGRKAIKGNEELCAKASLTSYVDKEKDIPPTLMIHGNMDRVVPYNQSVRLYEYLKSQNRDVTFYALNNADHGGAMFWTEDVMGIVTDFIDGCVSQSR